MSIYVYESLGQITGKRSSYEELIDAISVFSRQSVLWHCAALNYGIRTWESNRREVGEFRHDTFDALNHYFPRSIAARLHAGYFAREPRVVFHRRQLLTLQKLTLVHSDEAGRNVDFTPYAFGHILLMINDHLHNPNLSLPEKLSTDLDFARLIGEFIPITEIGNEELGATLARTLYMLGPITQARLGQSLYYDAMELFESTTGVDRASFRAFIFASQAYLNSLTFRKLLKAPGDLYLNHFRFVHTALSSSQIAAMFRILSGSPSKLAKLIRNRDFGVGDSTALRMFPLVDRWMNTGLISQWCGHLVLDPIYLWDRLLAAPYWLASDTHGDRFRSFWGNLFEDYCGELMTEATASSKAVYRHDVHLKKDVQLCDGLLLEGDTLVVLEYKGFMLSAESKYSANPVKLRDNIYGNLVRNSAGKKKGVEQLEEAITALFGPERGIEKVFSGWRDIRRVLPCIVTLDPIGGVVGISTMLQLYLRSENLPIARSPVFCIPVSELERRAPFFNSMGLAAILSRWLEINPTLGTPLSQIEMSLGAQNEITLLRRVDSLKADAAFLFPGEDFS